MTEKYYLDKDDVLNKLHIAYELARIDQKAAVSTAIADINAIPAADVIEAYEAEPVKRGHWYHNTSKYVSELDAYFIQACCSCCNRYSDRIDQYSQIMSNETCSHCGADMRGERNDT